MSRERLGVKRILKAIGQFGLEETAWTDGWVWNALISSFCPKIKWLEKEDVVSSIDHGFICVVVLHVCLFSGTLESSCEDRSEEELRSDRS